MDEEPVEPGDVDEEFRSLLEGLRTTLPGVQLVTAFLLTVPLYDRYQSFDRSERVAYYVAFATAAAGSLLLMAPSSHQRVRARSGTVVRHSRRHLIVAVRLTIVGSVLFAVALAASGYLVSSLVLGTPAAIAVTVVASVLLGWSWFYLPLVDFRKR